MPDKLQRYKALDYDISHSNIAWRMYEAGVENFGKNGADLLNVPKPAANEVLLRVDAIGICFSDIKLITQGTTHARITGRDLIKQPVIAGHEASLTVFETGSDYKSIYCPGDRLLIQPDVFYKGVSLAFGYALAGAMQQFVIVGDEVLKGDEGNYLIPVAKSVGYVETALVEPWTCVVAAYRIFPRRFLTKNGTLLVVGLEDKDYIFDKGLVSGGIPSKVILSNVSAKIKESIAELCKGAEIVEIDKLIPDTVKALCQERTGEKGFNDVIILGTPTADLAEAISLNLAKHAVMAISAQNPIDRATQIDVGRVHYDYIDYVGTDSLTVSDAYTKSRDSEMKPNGSAWFIGAAGPMGQMHVQRCVLKKDGPKKILCTDVDSSRLLYLKESLGNVPKENGIEIIFINPMEAGNDAQAKAIQTLTNGKGFDDIMVLAPIAPLINAAVPHLAKGGLMNIFAGIIKGTMATIDLSCTFVKGSRFVGSSGSRPQDMVDTLKLTETGELPTKNSCAAIGGIDAMADGVRAVKEAKFPGKTVIFPHITLPLTPLAELDKILPSVHAKLANGKFWTQEAEDELLNLKLDI